MFASRLSFAMHPKCSPPFIRTVNNDGIFSAGALATGYSVGDNTKGTRVVSLGRALASGIMAYALNSSAPRSEEIHSILNKCSNQFFLLLHVLGQNCYGRSFGILTTAMASALSQQRAFLTSSSTDCSLFSSSEPPLKAWPTRSSSSQLPTERSMCLRLKFSVCEPRFLGGFLTPRHGFTGLHPSWPVQAFSMQVRSLCGLTTPHGSTATHGNSILPVHPVFYN
eukprot:Gb_29152 [translate_table: standard]